MRRTWTRKPPLACRTITWRISPTSTRPATSSAAGPLFDDEFRCLSILNVEPERAPALKEQNPAVKAGRFSVKVIPWMVPAGAMSFAKTHFPRSTAEVGDG